MDTVQLEGVAGLGRGRAMGTGSGVSGWRSRVGPGWPLTWIHFRSTSSWNPAIVRLKGSRMNWASEVTSRVLSVPSASCTRMQAPSLWAQDLSTEASPSLPWVAGPGIECTQF